MDYSNVRVKDLKRVYDEGFVPSKDYLDGMPDMQNSQYKENIPIQMVGVHDVMVPMMINQLDGNVQEVQAHITGTVSLEAEKKGINMSRITRQLYTNLNHPFSVNDICNLLQQYKDNMDTFDAHILVKFKYRMWQEALRSAKDDGTKEGGWMYYDVCFDVNLDREGKFRKVMWLDFVYSSACCCSAALSEYAALTRGVYAIPHSQRSVARVGIEFDDFIWIEDLVKVLRQELTTEVLVFCKRIDEMAFAEKNGAQPKFVEDAIRLIGNALNGMNGVRDYKVIVSHLESLHRSQAIAVITKGLPDSKFEPWASFDEIQSLTR